MCEDVIRQAIDAESAERLLLLGDRYSGMHHRRGFLARTNFDFSLTSVEKKTDFFFNSSSRSTSTIQSSAKVHVRTLQRSGSAAAQYS